MNNVNFLGTTAILSKVRRAAPEIEEKFVGDGHIFSEETVKEVTQEVQSKLAQARKAAAEKNAYTSPFDLIPSKQAEESTFFPETTPLKVDFFA